jgi:acyl carrier protein
MTQSEFLAQVDEVLELQSGTVKLDDDLEEHGWSSLSRISFIAMLDEQFGIAVTGQQLANCAKVRDLMQFVKDKLED